MSKPPIPPRKIAVDPGYLRPKDAANYLGFPVGTLKKWRFRKKGPPYIKISRKLVVYKISDLDDWLVRRKELASFDITAKMLGLE